MTPSVQSVASASPGRREIAVALIVARDGRMLLQMRDDDPKITNPNAWGLFGGHLEPGERAQDALLRELNEELAWRPRHFELFTTRAVTRDGWDVVSHAFGAHLDVPLEKLRLGEGQDLALFAPDALPANTPASTADLIHEFGGTDAHRRMKRRWDTITTTAIITDTDGRFLLQHRDDKPGIVNPGKWGSFGGELEPHETPEDGMLRELEEELSWRPNAIASYGALPIIRETESVLVYVFSCALDVPAASLVLGEGQGMGWFSADALPKDIVPELGELIRRFAASR
jgi:8-oxo-dGTP diphosphatase